MRQDRIDQRNERREDQHNQQRFFVDLLQHLKVTATPPSANPATPTTDLLNSPPLDGTTPP